MDMVRIVFVVILLGLVPSTAHAGWAPAAPDQRDFYIGAAVFPFVPIIAEASLDGGWRLPDAPLLWVRGRLAAGAEFGDFSSEEWTAGMAGFELRTRHRFLRVVLGLEGGLMQKQTEHEDDNRVDTEYGFAWSWHAFVEVGDRVMGRLGVQSPAAYGAIPAPTFGLAVRF
jgi:hypothetical protein